MRRSSALAALAVGIGTARLVETVKEAVPLIPPAQYKSLSASAIAGALGAVLVDGNWRERTLSGLAATGVAMLAHELQAVLSLTGDRQKFSVLQGSLR